MTDIALPEPVGYVSDFRDEAVFSLSNPNDCGIAVFSAVGLASFAREAVMADRRRISDLVQYPTDLLLQAASFYGGAPTGQYDDEAESALRAVVAIRSLEE